MKHFVLGFFLVIGYSGFAQKDGSENVEKKNSTSLSYETDQSQRVTLLSEYSGREIFGLNGSLIRQVGVGSIDIGRNGVNYRNVGFSGAAGPKLYLNKDKNQGFNVRNLVELNFFTFTEQSGRSGYFSYISFVNPTVGYKLKIRKIIFEPYLGYTWAILIPMKGTVDRESFNNFMPKLGLSIGI